jgi:hypothetical protein
MHVGNFQILESCYETSPLVARVYIIASPEQGVSFERLGVFHQVRMCTNHGGVAAAEQGECQVYMVSPARPLPGWPGMLPVLKLLFVH